MRVECLYFRELGKGASLSSFTGSQCVLRRGDGAEVVAGIPPYPLVLHRLLANHQWDKAAKLCHAVKVCTFHAYCRSLDIMCVADLKKDLILCSKLLSWLSVRKTAYTVSSPSCFK